LTALECSQPYSSATATGLTAGGVRGLDVGGQITLTYDVLIDAADKTAGITMITNTAAVEDRAGIDSDTAVVEVAREEAALEISKSAGVVTTTGNGVYTVSYDIEVLNPVTSATCANNGTDGCMLIDNTNVQANDGLDTVFGSALVSATATITAGTCAPNPAYTGIAPNTDLLVGTDTLASGQSCTITVAAVVTADTDVAGSAPLGVTTNTASAASDQITTPVTADADAVLAENPAMVVTKTLSMAPTNNGDGTYSLEYTIDVDNTGDVDLRAVQVLDGLGDPAVFGSALSAQTPVVSPPCDVNPAYTGLAPNDGLLDGDDIIPVGGTCQIVLSVTVTVDSGNPDSALIDTDYTNTASGSGVGPAGTPASSSDTAVTQFTEDPMLDITKAVSAGPANNGDGTYDLTYEVVVTNTGNVELRNTQLTDDLAAIYGAGLVSASASVTAGPCTANPLYDGVAVSNLLDGTDTLPLAGACTVEITVSVDAANAPAGAPLVNTDILNQVGAQGTSPFGETVSGSATAMVQLVETPAIDVTKAVSSPTANNGDGTYDVTYEIMVANTGDVELIGVQVADGLDALFGSNLQSVANTVTAGPCVANPAYDGVAVTDLLDGLVDLAVAGSCTIEVAVTVLVDATDPAGLSTGLDAQRWAERWPRNGLWGWRGGLRCGDSHSWPVRDQRRLHRQCT